MLDSNKILKVNEVYAPSTASDGGEPEPTLIVKSTSTVVMGDFNTKFGHREKLRHTGRYCIGKRNDRDDRMAAKAETNRFVGNT